MIESRKEDTLKIYEESYKWVWAAISVTTFVAAGLLFDNLQNSSSWVADKLLIVLISALFTVGIWSIYKVFEDLYHIILSVKGDALTIQIFEGEELIREDSMELDEIEQISFYSTDPPGPFEALYDYSTSYQMVYKPFSSEKYKRFIDLQPHEFTLKIEDIGAIVTFLRKYKASIAVPDQHKTILGVD